MQNYKGFYIKKDCKNYKIVEYNKRTYTIRKYSDRYPNFEVWYNHHCLFKCWNISDAFAFIADDFTDYNYYDFDELTKL